VRSVWSYRYDEYEYEYASGCSTCFPSSGTVHVKDANGPRRMDELELGDLVEVEGGAFEPVYMFGGHRVSDAQSDMVTITTDGNSTLSLSPSHWLYKDTESEQQAVRAANILIGDTVYVHGKITHVVAKEMGTKSGLFNPLTASGTIIVNGFVASTYATATHPSYMHAVLTPVRLLSKLAPSYIPAANTLLESLLNIDGTAIPTWLSASDLVLSIVTEPKLLAIALFESTLPTCVSTDVQL